MAKKAKRIPQTKFKHYLFDCIYRYPTLYGSLSLNDAKMKVLDQFLNVIGNGIRDDKELLDVVAGFERKLKKADIAKYVTISGVLWYGYTEANVKRVTIGEGAGAREFVYPQGNPENFYITSEEEKAQHPEIVKWSKSTFYGGFSPYPNFGETHSTIYQCPAFFQLDVSWLEAALWYYKNCQKWFESWESDVASGRDMSDKTKFGAMYSYAFPGQTQQETDERVKQLQGFLKNPKYQTNADISEAYECEFTGSKDNYQDVYDFLVRRWAKEYARINQFLTKTIDLLETNITLKGRKE